MCHIKTVNMSYSQCLQSAMLCSIVLVFVNHLQVESLAYLVYQLEVTITDLLVIVV